MLTNPKMPLDILQGEAEKTDGEEIQASIFAVAKEFSDFMASTLGPQSLHKLIVEQDRWAYIITSDGETILQRFDLMQFKAKHPVARLMVELSKTQDYDLGDGTTSTVVLAGNLLREAEKLISIGLHPNTVAAGYKFALKRALIHARELASPATSEDLFRVAMTALDTKYATVSKEPLSRMVVDAVMKVSDGGRTRADPKDIHVVKRKGTGVFNSTLFHGFIIEKSMLNESMPERMEAAKIAVIDLPLTVKRYAGIFGDNPLYEIEIKDIEGLKIHREEEKGILMRMFSKLKNVGADCVISRKLIDPRVGRWMADAGIIGVQGIPSRDDLKRLSRAVGANIISDLDTISSNDLGSANLVEVKKYPNKETLIFIENEAAGTVTILLRGGAHHVLSEVERAMKDAVHSTSSALNDGGILPAGGACEVYIAARLKKDALALGDKRQLAVEAFATALEGIPRTLVRNSGLDQIKLIMDLRREQNENGSNYGFDANSRQIRDMKEAGIIESLSIKESIYKGAFETADILLRSESIITGMVFESRIESELKKKNGEK
ncbi:MAG: thermosome subunit beta [Candidatus Syntropharchaeales archaeon]